MPGFPKNDHKRVSKATQWVEQNQNNRPLPPPSEPDKRGLVRVMLLGELYWGDPDLPLPLSGDFPLDGRVIRANITEPISTDRRQRHYVVRCVATDMESSGRTWQLRVISPEGESSLTTDIAEHATAAEVKAAIDSTGCPPVDVFGKGNYVYDVEGEVGTVDLPARQWHIAWTDPTWQLTSTREVSPETFEYETLPGEVPIALIPTAYKPTPFAELVCLPYSRPVAATTLGAFALCQPLPGRGLVIVDLECWNFTDV